MKPKITNTLSLDYQMVIGEWKDLVGQVAICNYRGQCVYNYFIKHLYVQDYLADITGITPNHLRSGKKFRVVHREVADIIRDKLLVGYDLDNALSVLGLGHPEWNRRDLAYYFENDSGDCPSLKYLAEEYIGWTIQDGYHDAVEDARAAMHIYKQIEEEWEEELSSEYDSSDY